MNTRQQRLVEHGPRKIVQEVSSHFGQFRIANPDGAPKAFQLVQKRAQRYFDRLADSLNKLHDDQVSLGMALYALKRDITTWGGAPPEAVAPLAVELAALLGSPEPDYKQLLTKLRMFLKSDELQFGVSKVPKEYLKK